MKWWLSRYERSFRRFAETKVSIESVRTSARQKCGIAHYALLFGDSDESVNPSAHHFRSNICFPILTYTIYHIQGNVWKELHLYYIRMSSSHGMLCFIFSLPTCHIRLARRKSRGSPARQIFLLTKIVF